jgi:uncharacterized protein involved in exopolysaccharide biosynthesis
MHRMADRDVRNHVALRASTGAETARALASRIGQEAAMPTREQLFEIYRLFRRAAARHRTLGMKVFIVGVILALVGAVFMPRSYYSEARLFVRFGRENQVDPTASGGQMVALYESRESEINSLIEILKSRAIFDRVVDAVTPEFVLYGRAGNRTNPHPGPLPKGEGVTQPTKRHQLAVARLIKEVTISAPRKSNIITVSCKAPSPAIAQQIVAKLVEVYQDEHVRVHRSPGSYEFFSQQAQQSLTAWQKAADDLRAAKDRLGIVTLEGKRKHLDDTFADINMKRLTNQSEARATQAKIAAIEGQIARLPETLITQETTGASAAADGMRQTLYTLETQEHELSAKMHDSHPRLIAVRKQVAELREVLNQQPSDRVQATEAINPSRQSLELALLTEKSHSESLAAADRALAAQQGQLRSELAEHNAQSIAIDELTQRVALAEANHKEYAQRLEQARISRTLDDERISSLSLVQPASYVATPAGPRRSLVLALGLFVAALSGLGSVLVAAWLNPLITTQQQLIAAIDLPLTGVVPRDGLAMAA